MRPLVLAWIVSVLVFAAPAAERLNVVFFLIDDLGWTDLGCYGAIIMRRRMWIGCERGHVVHRRVRGELCCPRA